VSESTMELREEIQQMSVVGKQAKFNKFAA